VAQGVRGAPLSEGAPRARAAHPEFGGTRMPCATTPPSRLYAGFSGAFPPTIRPQKSESRVRCYEPAG